VASENSVDSITKSHPKKDIPTRPEKTTIYNTNIQGITKPAANILHQHEQAHPIWLRQIPFPTH
jgi:hypothetical protein